MHLDIEKNDYVRKLKEGEHNSFDFKELIFYYADTSVVPKEKFNPSTIMDGLVLNLEILKFYLYATSSIDMFSIDRFSEENIADCAECLTFCTNSLRYGNVIRREELLQLFPVLSFNS